ncbi:MAG: hypothetical protein ABSA02_43250 [Trebonia sp.]|jgi:hypothetical protein
MWNVADRDQDGRDDDDAPHDPGAVRDPNAYWRRRFFILGGGVALLGLCAWLFPGSQPAAPRASATAQASMAALAKRGTLPPAAYGSAWPGPTPTKTAAASPSPSATQRKTKASAHPDASPGSAATASSGSRCPPADIVLSLFTGAPSYGKGAQPKFDVYAVSTSSAACTLSYGPGSVQVVVTRHGRVIWDSAACKLAAVSPVRFTLGVPQLLTITWDRQASKPSGCAGSLPSGTRGTFDAVALADGQSSPVHSFRLAG